ncbi:unnamed protein product [Durusdinium trenchii]|uniref:Uncharacterized protein n=1 Tax=Durusdinium trenchii TaxID=1381693 RepID=A0ABP0RZ02_9DINO
MAVLIRHNVGIGRVSFGRIACRNLHKGHVGATLEKLNLPRHHWLKEVEQAPEKATVRRMKDTYLRELGEARAELQGLFGPEERSAIVKPTVQEEERIRDTKKRRELNNEALRAYRMLRPQAAPFYEEDAMLGMKAKMNKITKEDTNLPDLPESAKANEFVDPFQQYLPVVNQKAFLFALESVTASLAKDLRVLCKWIHGPDSVSEEDGPQALGFRKLVDRLFDLKLKKDPDAAAGWVEKHWSLLEQLLPKEVVAPKEEKEEAIAKWLEGHLSRVKENQLRYEETDQKIFLHRERSAAEYYNFAEDFPYDDDPLPGLLADERNLDFPLEKATEFMQLFLRIISSSKCADDAKGILGEDGTVVADVANQFQDLVWSLEEIGLRNWLKMDLDELRRNLPQGPLSPLTLSSENADDLKLEPDDVEVAKTMLKCAARGKADLLDFEAVDPYKLLCGKPPNVDEFHKELSGLPEPVL